MVKLHEEQPTWQCRIEKYADGQADDRRLIASLDYGKRLEARIEFRLSKEDAENLAVTLSSHEKVASDKLELLKNKSHPGEHAHLEISRDQPGMYTIECNVPAEDQLTASVVFWISHRDASKLVH
jgi:hypothetical protein